ncbi:FAD-binding oxidoreductase [Catenovulum sp. SM1970]|uniref:FAD-binding oxidoreductase n=1 Tax=Marinifaba aquimaris TaxID=2741323 RepID=UPI001573F383|nr:FAD-binding oxidoreductase [Marinifaba aquimaris]NTS75939.1 FAD-binding oxidoreductase [Marinifaba aquimaris]
MELTSWGQYPRANSELFSPSNQLSLTNALIEQTEASSIARGLGRSYGDSALANKVIRSNQFTHFIDFDVEKGILTCGSGVSLADILATFVPKGWFVQVTPGTKFVTVGGAIASDVHGKNHHLDGCFSQHVLGFKMALASGEVVHCSRQSHPELFFATCGGMGLTGVIVEVELQLLPISSSYINQTTIKAENLEQALTLFEQHYDTTYSVAWIDCLATGDSLGRSLLMFGEHDSDGALEAGSEGKLAVPFNMPSFLLNKYSIQAFNSLYYARVRESESQQYIHYEPFFYPLDGIHNWNRMYGKNGFTQYQFAIPKENGLAGMTEILTRISDSKRGSFLAVLKAFGQANDNYLSFPIEGYTLALDFKLEPGLFELLEELDQIVLAYGGRLYLTKDARMSEQTFKQSYPLWTEFDRVRKEYGADKLFNSHQSKRLGL